MSTFQASYSVQFKPTERTDEDVLVELRRFSREKLAADCEISEQELYIESVNERVQDEPWGVRRATITYHVRSTR